MANTYAGFVYRHEHTDGHIIVGYEHTCRKGSGIQDGLHCLIAAPVVKSLQQTQRSSWVCPPRSKVSDHPRYLPDATEESGSIDNRDLIVTGLQKLLGTHHARRIIIQLNLVGLKIKNLLTEYHQRHILAGEPFIAGT